jgi:predicted ATPase
MVGAALDLAHAGAPTMTLIVGEAGIGKTRLAVSRRVP